MSALCGQRRPAPSPSRSRATHGSGQRDEGNTRQHLHGYEVCSSAASRVTIRPCVGPRRLSSGRRSRGSRWRHWRARSRAAECMPPPGRGLSRRRSAQLRHRTCSRSSSSLRELPRPGCAGADRRRRSHELPADLRPATGRAQKRARSTSRSSTTVRCRCRLPTRRSRSARTSVRRCSSGSPAARPAAQPSTPASATKAPDVEGGVTVRRIFWQSLHSSNK